VFGFLTHLTMPDLVMLWKTSTSSGGRVGINRERQLPPGAGPRPGPRGNFPAIWLAGGGQARVGRARGGRRRPGAKRNLSHLKSSSKFSSPSACRGALYVL
jgi:hypothetical protein